MNMNQSDGRYNNSNQSDSRYSANQNQTDQRYNKDDTWDKYGKAMEFCKYATKICTLKVPLLHTLHLSFIQDQDWRQHQETYSYQAKTITTQTVGIMMMKKGSFRVGL